MCGIAGVVGPGMAADALRRQVTSMTQALRHRGPDGAGYHVDAGVALGHRRLGIIDLSARGDQPLYNEDRSICLVLNGEIYNYASLRRDLVRRGHTFRGASDSEVVVHLYEEFGAACVEHLEGMFALAVHDRRRSQVFLARDRIGEKPLYYARHAGAFYFASEIKSLRRIPGLVGELCEDAIVAYFTNTQVPAPLSMYRGVRKLLPAHGLVVSADGCTRTAPYWSLDYTAKWQGSDAAAAQQLEALLARTIAHTAVADVPIGVTLSGGIDSSMVLALARGAAPERALQSFTLGRVHGSEVDEEINRAHALAHRYGTEHHVLGIGAIEWAACSASVARLDEPVGIYDVLHMDFLTARIAEHVRVILSGNGADETFAGYASYNAVRRQAESMVGASRDALDARIHAGYSDAARWTGDLLLSKRLARHAEAFLPEVFLGAYRDLARYDNWLDARLFTDLLLAVHHSATMMDAVGMAHSVEVRSPFFAHPVVEFAAALPLELKVRSREDARLNKYALKCAARAHLPAELIFADKLRCGQFIDYEAMLRGPWRVPVSELLSWSCAQPGRLFSPRKVTKLWSAFLRGSASADEQVALRKLVMFALWWRSQT